MAVSQWCGAHICMHKREGLTFCGSTVSTDLAVHVLCKGWLGSNPMGGVQRSSRTFKLTQPLVVSISVVSTSHGSLSDFWGVGWGLLWNGRTAKTVLVACTLVLKCIQERPLGGYPFVSEHWLPHTTYFFCVASQEHPVNNWLKQDVGLDIPSG